MNKDLVRALGRGILTMVVTWLTAGFVARITLDVLAGDILYAQLKVCNLLAAMHSEDG